MRVLAILAASALLAGCVAVQTPVTGSFYNDSKGPVTVGTGEGGSKVGTACTEGALGVVLGDASIEAAKAKGGITRVSSVDHTVTTVLAIYAKYCTVVRGE